jgi:hypothetical protein
VAVVPTETPHLLAQLHEAATEAALDDVGKGEELANNQGPYVWSLTGRKTRGAWCAAAVYTWLLRGSVASGLRLPVKRTHSARRLAKAIAGVGRMLSPNDLPRRGDVALWSRGVAWQGHVGIIAEVGLTRFRCVEGNRGKFPAKVDVFSHTLGERRLLGFARLY